MELDFKKSLKTIIDFHQQEIERLKREQLKTDKTTDEAKWFCIEGEIYSLNKSFGLLYEFEYTD